MPNFNGKKIIITGASKGLGLSMAEALSAAGAQLVLMARSEEGLMRTLELCKSSVEHMSIAVDLTNMDKLGEAVGRARNFLGNVDVVLHSAGGGLGLRDELLGSEDLWRLFMTNLGAAAEINRIVVPEMKKRGSGNLVHVGSIASSEGVGSVGYNTMKAALAAYVRTLGRKLAENHIVVTGILPGGFMAPKNAMERLASGKPEAYDQFIKDRLPRKQMGEVKELIPMLSLLCSDDASMMAGCLVPIDAGEGVAYNL